jgi:lysozyme
METEIPQHAVDLVKRWEGLHKVKADGLVYPYVCPAGVWTIGYGSTRDAWGLPIRSDTPPMSPQDCETLMLGELRRCVKSALRYSPILSEYPNALGAVASFIFNLGAGRYLASTLRRKINEGQWEEAKEQIVKWVYASGRRLPGLVARRNDEAQYLC